jgi:uncharacterized protein YhfF
LSHGRLRCSIEFGKSVAGEDWMMDTRSMSPAVKRFWAAFLHQTDDPLDAKTRLYEVFQIGDSEADADEGADLIVAGIKTATSSLLWEYEATGNRQPTKGVLSILTNGSAEPVCIVETTWLKVQAFSQVDAQFARDYGEWDGTLETWRKECSAYYSNQCEALNRIPSPDMPILCERFRVVFPKSR